MKIWKIYKCDLLLLEKPVHKNRLTISVGKTEFMNIYIQKKTVALA